MDDVYCTCITHVNSIVVAALPIGYISFTSHPTTMHHIVCDVAPPLRQSLCSKNQSLLALFLFINATWQVLLCVLLLQIKCVPIVGSYIMTRLISTFPIASKTARSRIQPCNGYCLFATRGVDCSQHHSSLDRW